MTRAFRLTSRHRSLSHARVPLCRRERKRFIGMLRARDLPRDDMDSGVQRRRRDTIAGSRMMSLPLDRRPARTERAPTEEGGLTAAARSARHSDVARRAFAVTNPVSAQLTIRALTSPRRSPSPPPRIHIYNGAWKRRVYMYIHTHVHVHAEIRDPARSRPHPLSEKLSLTPYSAACTTHAHIFTYTYTRKCIRRRKLGYWYRRVQANARQTGWRATSKKETH